MVSDWLWFDCWKKRHKIDLVGETPRSSIFVDHQDFFTEKYSGRRHHRRLNTRASHHQLFLYILKSFLADGVGMKQDRKLLRSNFPPYWADGIQPTFPPSLFFFFDGPCAFCPLMDNSTSFFSIEKYLTSREFTSSLNSEHLSIGLRHSANWHKK